MNNNNNEERTNDLFYIPKHHMMVIATFSFLFLIVAIFLPTPEISANKVTTSNIPDYVSVHNNEVIYADDPNATESIDAETIPDAELQVQSDEDTAKNEWEAYTIKQGDTTNSILNDRSISFEAIQAIQKLGAKGKYIADLTLGDNIYIRIDDSKKIKDNSALEELIIPINKKEQIHYTRIDTEQNEYKFTAEIEPLVSPVDEREDETKTPDTSITQEEQKPAIGTTAKEEQSTLDNLQKEEISEAKQKELEIQQKQEIVVPKPIVSKPLHSVKIDRNLNNSLTKSGMSQSEAKTVETALINGGFNPRRVKPNEEIRILFGGKDRSEIVAVLYKPSNKNKTIAMFRNPKDKKFYSESGTLTTTRTASNNFRRPIPGKVRITSNFNPNRKHPITKRIRPHNGTDFGVPTGTKVYAPANGKVVKATFQRAAGNYIVIQHAGNVSTVYMHLSKILVKPGQHVKQGTLIARSGNTGASTGPHLHYELRINNRPVNAMKHKIASSTTSTVKHSKEFKNKIAEYKRGLKI